ncbi:SDR family oxidoreductase [Arthrobacter sp. zg-Y1143]|uniref:SDR family oxidoreductase n=1 Tax=Arthrobacter sp. zg-Y1143 TaxID=3049065 RepID=UPI0024C45B9F|nr:SDR family oxidoreductase [Arthrobacter sp. zg-Y1143]MDK1326829.1 SDR family oxidoreductase [Arthrobacter sp. zg-Y1143]
MTSAAVPSAVPSSAVLSSAFPSSAFPLSGRTAVVTGVSRRRGIGYAIASRLAAMGANLFVQHYAPNDEAQPWGADSIDDLLRELRGKLVGDARLDHAGMDLAPADGARQLVDAARDAFGHVDILVCNHAMSGSDGRLLEMTPEKLDAHWQVNTRSTLLATRYFAEQHDGRPGGRVIWLTSGQSKGPMPAEIAYATSKGALAGITASVADDLIGRGIVLNTVNPGPVNTGYLDDATRDRPSEELEAVLAHFPGGRFGEPDDPARLVAWLVSDEGRWMVGQVLNTEGGFRRW